MRRKNSGGIYGSSRFKVHTFVGKQRLDRTFADFACHEQRLVIEVDGGGHAQSDQIVADERRTEYLQSRGYRVLRFWNNDIFENIEGVISVISAALEETPAPHP